MAEEKAPECTLQQGIWQQIPNSQAPFQDMLNKDIGKGTSRFFGSVRTYKLSRKLRSHNALLGRRRLATGSQRSFLLRRFWFSGLGLEAEVKSSQGLRS